MSKLQRTRNPRVFLIPLMLCIGVAPIGSALATASNQTSPYAVASEASELRIDPSNAVLDIDQVLDFDVLGEAITPLSWSTTDPSVATIDSEGKLRSVAVGICRVQVEDATGAVGYTDLIHVTSLVMSAPDGSLLNDRQPHSLALRIDGDVAASMIRAFSIDISYDDRVLEAVGAGEMGSLTDGWGAPSFSASPGHIHVAHAGVTPLSASGTLLSIEFQTRGGAPNQSRSVLVFQSIRLNEGEIAARSVRGNVIVSGEPILIESVAVNPSAGELSLGSTRQFTAIVTGSGPATVTWEIVDGEGTINTSGQYVAPYVMPTVNLVAIRATSTADPGVWGQALITLTDPVAASTLGLWALKNPGRERVLTLYVTSSETISSSPTLTAAGQPVSLDQIGQDPGIYRGSLVVLDSASSIQLTAQATTGSGEQTVSTTVVFGE